MGGYYKIKNYVNCDFIITNTSDLKSFVIESGWDSKVEFIPNLLLQTRTIKKNKSLQNNFMFGKVS